MASLRFDAICKVFQDGTRALSDITLAIEDGELMVLVGPSGCGKSTLLRLVAGLEEPTSGDIAIAGRSVTGLSPQRRNIAMVFQNYALYPHMTVRQNLSFPLEMLKQPRGEISKRVGHIAALLDLEPFMERRPAALSGGQRQRVAMGRALVREPAVFLMDEPLSNLDAKLRVQMRREVVALQKRLGTTTLYVTHDQTEAMTMGDRLAVLHAGRLEQVGSPAALYERPDSLFVATFIGSPGMNLIAARLETAGEGEPAFRFGEQVIRLGAAVRARQPRLGERVGADVVIGIRPEVFVPAGQAPTAHQVSLRVEACEMLGHETLVHARAPVRRFPYGDEPPPDDTGGALLIARLPAVTDLAPGDRLEVAIDADRCTVFDPAGPVI